MSRLIESRPESLRDMAEILAVTLNFGGANYPAVDVAVNSIRKYHGTRPDRVMAILNSSDLNGSSVASIVDSQISELTAIGFAESKTVLKLRSIMDPSTYQNNS